MNKLSQLVRLFLYLLLIFVSNITQSKAANTCYPNLPEVKISISEVENYSINGQEFTRHSILVDNTSDIPNELFNSAPHLPPTPLWS